MNRKILSFTPCMLVLFMHVVGVSAQQVAEYYVLSDDQPSTLNQCQVKGCYSLPELLNSNILSKNISNILVTFHPGVHTLNSSNEEAFSFDNATNFTLTAANLSEHATIKCKGRTAFAFSFCKNLAIQGINFEGCTGHKPVTSQNQEVVFNNFSLLILYSLHVNMSAVTVRNSGGIGLLAINVCGSFVLSDSVFSNNTGSVCFISTDSVNIISIDTDIDIKNSRFEWATSTGYGNLLTGHLHSAGTVFKLVQSKFKIRVLLSNVTLIKNKNYDIAAYVKFPTNQLKMDNVISVNLIDEYYGMLILPSTLHNIYCNTFEAAVTINNVQLRRSKLYVMMQGKKSEKCELHMALSNILIDKVGSRPPSYPIFISGVPSITVRDITIEDTIGLVIFLKCNLQLQGQFVYQHNHGSIALFKNKLVIHNAAVTIKNNTVTHHAPFFIYSSEIDIQKSFITVKNNTGLEGGGIVLVNSTASFTGKSQATFLYNTAQRGGAMAFYQRSKLIFYDGVTNFTFVGNYVRAKGGAIYVHDEEYVDYYALYTKCEIAKYSNFLQYIGGKSSFHMFNNHAAQAGSAVFGGSINDNFYFHSPSVNDTSIVSSTPFKVCMCTNSKPNCYIENITVELEPGQSYTLEITAVGQRNGTVPSTIKAEFIRPSKGQLTQIQHVQAVDRACTNLTYTVNFSKDTELLQLTTIDQTWKKKTPLNIKFHRKNCTIGFILDTQGNKCICSRTIIDHGMECDIQTLRINRLNPKWISSTYVHLNPIVRLPEVIIHDYCPFDYCIAISQSLDLQYPDQQCDFNRSGILCGGCITNYSHVLGTSKCKQCSKPWIVLIIPLIAVAGVILVASLMLLNLTVSGGTIHGLIFYANIVRANHSIFFPQDVSTSFLSTFIAWLNLDLGIETCFYDGFSTFSNTWFQFLFPFYIWFILSVIIIVSHYSTQISRVVGNNAVQVLATLFLVSYAKLLRIIIIVFSSTVLVYPDNYHRTVWLYDGNVDYLKGKHIPLFMAALVLLIFVSFPFTMIVLCTQCIQRLSNKRLLSWVGKLQPLFDAYTGPYKIKHRYWIGLLLLIRVCLYLVFSLNTIGNPMINLLTICIAMSCLLAYLSLIGGVYKQWWLNVIETAFILNLLILSSGSFYHFNTGTSNKPITYTSTGITLVLFICILVYHFFLKVMKTKFSQVIKIKLTNYLHLLTKLKSSGQNELKYNQIRFKQKDEVTYSEVTLEKPLLECD